MFSPGREGITHHDHTPGVASTAIALNKVFGQQATKVHALRDVNLQIRAHAFTAIMGPSGSGKSTLLHCLAALDRPTSGHVFLGDIELSSLSRRQQTQVRRERIGFIFQAFNLVPTLTAYENITLPQLLAGYRPDPDWLEQVVSQVGLGDRLRHRPTELSGGQQQRVAVARALMGRPDVIFADEPTGNLDTQASQEVLHLLRQAVEGFGQTVVTATHDPIIASYADQILFFNDGRAVDRLNRPSVNSVLDQLQELEAPNQQNATLDQPMTRDDAYQPDGAARAGRRGGRRRRRRGGSPPVMPARAGSGEAAEVARQERWLQRIREQFEPDHEEDGSLPPSPPARPSPPAVQPAINPIAVQGDGQYGAPDDGGWGPVERGRVSFEPEVPSGPVGTPDSNGDGRPWHPETGKWQRDSAQWQRDVTMEPAPADRHEPAQGWSPPAIPAATYPAEPRTEERAWSGDRRQTGDLRRDGEPNWSDPPAGARRDQEDDWSWRDGRQSHWQEPEPFHSTRSWLPEQTDNGWGPGASEVEPWRGEPAPPDAAAPAEADEYADWPSRSGDRQWTDTREDNGWSDTGHDSGWNDTSEDSSWSDSGDDTRPRFSAQWDEPGYDPQPPPPPQAAAPVPLVQRAAEDPLAALKSLQAELERRADGRRTPRRNGRANSGSRARAYRPRS